MSRSVILVYLHGLASDAAALRAARSIAARRPSHIVSLRVESEMVDQAFIGAPETAPVATDIVEMAQQEAAERSARARQTFETWRTELRVPLADAPTKDAPITASWALESGAIGDVVARHGRLADLVVVPSEGPFAGPTTLPLEAALFAGGRPTLLVPRKAISSARR